MIQRRLLATTPDETVATSVAEAHRQVFTQMRRAYAHGEPERQQADEDGLALRDRIKASYPFHPALIDLMRERWAAIPEFQRTRGALRFLASCLRAAHRASGSRSILGPGDVAIHDNDVRLAFFEEELLYVLRAGVPEGVKVTVVADRGFADGKLFKALSEELGFEYVIRMRGDFYVTSAKGERRTAAQWVRLNGRTRTLRDAKVTDTHRMQVGTVVCVHDKDMKEPWCLVASERRVGTRTLVRYYAKRWGVETSFRDIKDIRFGMGMSSMKISRPERRDRLLVLSALSTALLTMLGAAGESLGYDRWLKANTVKRRTHSLFRQGLMLYEHIPNWPEERLRPLMERFGGV